MAESPLIRALASAPTFHALASAAILLLTLLPSTLRAQSTNEPPPFLRTGPSLTQAPEVCPDFMKARWVDRDGDGWEDMWSYLNAIAHRNQSIDTDGDSVSDYDEMLRWRDPRVKGPPLGWPNYTVEELLQAQIAAEAMRRTNEAAMARRRVELKRLEAGEVGKGVRGQGPRVVSMAQMHEHRLNRLRQKFAMKQPAREAALRKAREFMHRKGIPEVIKSASGKSSIFGGADENGNPQFHVTHNVTSAKTIQTNKLNETGGGGLGLNLTGKDVVLGHWDGADALFAHQDLGTSRIADIDTTSAEVNGVLAERIHATHTAGTMIGLGLNPAGGSNAAGDAHGMAASAALKSWDSFQNVIDMQLHYANTPAAGRVLVSNHSYGLGIGWDGDDNGVPIWVRITPDFEYPVTTPSRWGEYTALSAALDDHVFDAAYHLPVFSAGNHRFQAPDPLPTDKFIVRDANGLTPYTRTLITPPPPLPQYYLWLNPNGDPFDLPGLDGAENGGYKTVGQEASAKNVLCVGSVADLPNGYQGPESVVVSSFSSSGPTEEGRIKPDVVANGEELYSASFLNETVTDQYASLSGTSMAAPSVSGSLALLIQHYRNKYGDAAKLWASTLKALLIHTVDEVDSDGDPYTYYDGPDYRSGWGLVNVKRAAQLITDDAIPDETGAPRHALIREIHQDVLNFGEIEIPVVATGTEPLRATICWTDPVDLSLSHSNQFEVTITYQNAQNQTETAYHWRLNPDYPAAAAVRTAPPFGVGRPDVVYQVLIDAPEAGKTYTIHVNGCCWSEENHNFSDYAPVSLVVSGIVPEVPDLKITQVEKVDPAGIYSLGWQSNPGEIYRVETSTDLINWTPAKDENSNDLPDLLPQGMFSTKEVLSETSAEPRRFWRVRVVQPWEGAP